GDVCIPSLHQLVCCALGPSAGLTANDDRGVFGNRGFDYFEEVRIWRRSSWGLKEEGWNVDAFLRMARRKFRLRPDIKVDDGGVFLHQIVRLWGSNLLHCHVYAPLSFCS